MVDRDYSVEALTELGFAKPFIKRVMGMIAKSQYKRSLPSIPKIAMKTVGIDFHFAREWAGRPQ